MPVAAQNNVNKRKRPINGHNRKTKEQREVLATNNNSARYDTWTKSWHPGSYIYQRLAVSFHDPSHTHTPPAYPARKHAILRLHTG